MLDQRTAELGVAIRNAARCRGLELDEYQLEGYLLSLYRHDPADVLEACAVLWRDVDSRTMPTPAAIADRIRVNAREKAARHLLPAPAVQDDEHEFGVFCFAVLACQLRKEITPEQAEAAMDAKAREILSPDALRRYNAACAEARD
jgi:hypothetical protein